MRIDNHFKKIVSFKEMKSMEKIAIDSGKTESDLINNAGKEIARYIKKNFIEEKKILFILGKGNNAKDGYIAFKQLLKSKYEINILLVFKDSDYKSWNYDLNKYASKIYYLNDELNTVQTLINNAEIIIDGIFGIGLNRNITANISKLIKHINYSDKYIISIDVPSGLSSIYKQKNNNTNTIIANETLCISGIKDCCLSINGHKYSNKLINLDIGITKYPKNYKYKFLINPQSTFNLIPKKNTYGDKRLSGETLIVGGSKKYPGSILMAASATLNTGVGLLSLGIPLSIYDVIAGKIPEATLDTINNNNNEFISKDNIKYLFENKKRINSLLIGCGMESNNTTQASVDFLLKNISNHFKYLNGIVIDADGLNNLSKINKWWQYKLPNNTIITPHAREMSRLTGLSVNEINKNPIEILETYTKLWNVTIVLKGPLTFIGNRHKKYILNRPNPGLAKGGTGDVLAGVINSFLAQGLNSEHSTILAVSLISESGEISKEKYGIHGSTASKLLNNISKIINQNN
jgi:NAD(P)H-hydrate epimerase